MLIGVIIWLVRKLIPLSIRMIDCSDCTVRCGNGCVLRHDKG